jgi:hypothetical protein
LVQGLIDKPLRLMPPRKAGMADHVGTLDEILELLKD